MIRMITNLTNDCESMLITFGLFAIIRSFRYTYFLFNSSVMRAATFSPERSIPPKIDNLAGIEMSRMAGFPAADASGAAGAGWLLVSSTRLGRAGGRAARGQEPSRRRTLSTFSSMVWSRSVRVPSLMIVLIRGAPIS